MAIATPYSLALGPDDDAIDAVPNNNPGMSSGKMKIFLAATVDPAKMQSCVGALKTCFRALMQYGYRANSGQTMVARVPVGGGEMDVVVENDTVNIVDGDAAIIVSSTFDDNTTHFAEETFRQLLNVMLEQSKDN